DPLVVLQFGDYQAATGSWPEQLDGAEIAAKAINAAGGVNGRQIKVISCNSKGDVNEGAKCARDGVSGGAIEAVGSQQLNSQGSTKVFEASSMANVGNNPLAPVDFTSASSFPIVPGAATAVAAACAGLVEQDGIKSNVVVFGVDLAAGKTARDACQKSLDLRGVKSTVVVAPPGAPDMAPFVAQAMAQKPKAVVLSVLPSDIVKIATAFHQAGFTGRYASVISLYSAALAPQLAPTTDGALLGAKLPPPADASSSGLEQFRADAKKYGGNAPLTEYSMDSYISVHVVAEVAKTMTGPITPASFLKAMQAASNVKVPILGTLNFTTSAGIEGQPRLTNARAVLVRFEGGAFKTLGKFFDPYEVGKN
ncbi:MAG: hypothetical protein JWO68_2916, partial [Actinomycetia bacterium]|nr:hypothetical protein [Actinomycetes bacterium]